jgi:hypothetical protein
MNRRAQRRCIRAATRHRSPTAAYRFTGAYALLPALTVCNECIRASHSSKGPARRHARRMPPMGCLDAVEGEIGDRSNGPPVPLCQSQLAAGCSVVRHYAKRWPAAVLLRDDAGAWVEAMPVAGMYIPGHDWSLVHGTAQAPIAGKARSRGPGPLIERGMWCPRRVAPAAEPVGPMTASARAILCRRALLVEEALREPDAEHHAEVVAASMLSGESRTQRCDCVVAGVQPGNPARHGLNSRSLAAWQAGHGDSHGAQRPPGRKTRRTRVRVNVEQVFRVRQLPLCSQGHQADFWGVCCALRRSHACCSHMRPARSWARAASVRT